MWYFWPGYGEKYYTQQRDKEGHLKHMFASLTFGSYGNLHVLKSYMSLEKSFLPLFNIFGES